MEQMPNYYAVIPAPVRYDKELRPNAKLLYGELSALTVAKGYCWANNAYFAELFGLSKKTVGELIAQLAERGYIRTEVVRDEETNEVIERRIWIAELSCSCADPVEPQEEPAKEESGEGSPENSESTPPKNLEENNTSKNNTRNNIPPISPKGDASKRKGKEHYLPDVFAKVYKFYPRHTARAAAQKAWDKLKADEATTKAICGALRLQRTYWLVTKTPKDKIPHLSTWLNGRRWEDDPAEYAVPEDGTKDEGRTLPPEGVEAW